MPDLRDSVVHCFDAVPTLMTLELLLWTQFGDRFFLRVARHILGSEGVVPDAAKEFYPNFPIRVLQGEMNDLDAYSTAVSKRS
jgi:hypothetical protein